MLDASAKERVVDKRRVREMRHEAGILLRLYAGDDRGRGRLKQLIRPLARGHDQVAEARAMAEKFSALTALTDAFWARHLDDEYRALIHRVIEVRPMDLTQKVQLADELYRAQPYVLASSLS